MNKEQETPVKYNKKQKTGFPVVTETTSYTQMTQPTALKLQKLPQSFMKRRNLVEIRKLRVVKMGQKWTEKVY